MIRLLLAAAAMTASLSVNAHDKAKYPAPAKPLTAEYTIYSGSLGDEQQPTKDDRKIAFEVSGQPAKDIFESLYPDVQAVSCSDKKGERLRKKGRVWCVYTPEGGYRCFFGFNLRTGESIAGGSC